jgi:hypothetical protein
MTKEIAMKQVMNSVARALPAVLFFGACAMAQEPREGVAKLKDVHGNVLVSKESGLASGDENLRLTKGTRVITTSRSDVVVVFDNGCEVHLKENQRLEVDDGKPCSVLVAQAQSILSEPAGAAAATASGSAAIYSALLPALGGGLAGVKVIQSLRESQPVSPN